MQDREFDGPVKIAPAETTALYGDDGRSRGVPPRPVQGGSKHLAARKACMAVLQGRKAAKAARMAFAEAADEAEILVGGLAHGNNPVAKFIGKHKR